ncbi:MAG: GNAT family N-acetyltransferase [Proteobacteria bacterium]|nr:MAG: GNAT family N-acetyltransferase [Pseudomonadota bacterium]
MRQGKLLVPLANWYSFTWQPLFTPGAARAALLTAIARDLASKEKRVALWPLPDEDGSLDLLTQAFRAAGWAVLPEDHDSNHVLPVEGRSYEAYMAGRPGQLRTTLKRKAKKVVVELHTAFDEKAWGEYEAVYAASWKPSEGKPALLRKFAEQEGSAGRLRLGIARHDGRAIAAQFWTVEGHTAYIHKLAHTDEAAPLSAGTVLTAALFEQVIDRDLVKLVDFGTGDDPYKASWMETIRPRFRLEFHRPGNPASWPYLARAALRKLASTRSAG